MWYCWTLQKTYAATGSVLNSTFSFSKWTNWRKLRVKSFFFQGSRFRKRKNHREPQLWNRRNLSLLLINLVEKVVNTFIHEFLRIMCDSNLRFTLPPPGNFTFFLVSEVKSRPLGKVYMWKTPCTTNCQVKKSRGSDFENMKKKQEKKQMMECYFKSCIVHDPKCFRSCRKA